MTALVHSYAMLPIGPLAWLCGLTHWLFVPIYALICGELLFSAHGSVRGRAAGVTLTGFHRKPSAASGRRLFLSTLCAAAVLSVS